MLKDLVETAETLQEAANLEDLVSITEDFDIVNMMEASGEVCDEEDYEDDEDDEEDETPPPADDEATPPADDVVVTEGTTPLFDEVLASIS